MIIVKDKNKVINEVSSSESFSSLTNSLSSSIYASSRSCFLLSEVTLRFIKYDAPICSATYITAERNMPIIPAAASSTVSE